MLQPTQLDCFDEMFYKGSLTDYTVICTYHLGKNQFMAGCCIGVQGIQMTLCHYANGTHLSNWGYSGQIFCDQVQAWCIYLDRLGIIYPDNPAYVKVKSIIRTLSDKLQSSALPLSRYTLFGHIYAHYIEANLLSCFFKLDKI